MIFGIKTLPLIFANKFSHNGEQEKLNKRFNCKKEISENDKFEIIDILEKTGSIQKSLGEAKAHIVKARIILYALPENKYSILLSELVGYLSEIGDTVVDDIHSIKMLK